jgi:predicted phosphodiesterase
MARKTELKVGVISDVHCPYQDKKATKMALDYLEGHKLDKLFLLGDIIDFISISKFGTSLKRKSGLRDEVNETIQFLSDVKKRFPKTELIYTRGNHEERWDKYIIDHAPALEEVEGMRVQDVLKLKDLGIKWVPDKIRLNRMIFYHGTGRCSANAGATVKAWMDALYSSVIIGHIHRQAVISKRVGMGEEVIGVENPCLCEMDPDYIKGGTANWQQGGTLLTMNLNTYVNTPYPFRIENKKLYGAI